MLQLFEGLCPDAIAGIFQALSPPLVDRILQLWRREMFSVPHKRESDGFWLPLTCNKDGKLWSSRTFWIVLQRGL